MIKQKFLPAKLEDAGITALVATPIIFYGTSHLLWQIPYPYELENFNQHIGYWTAFQINEHVAPIFQKTAATYQNFLNRPEVDGSIYSIRFNLALTVSVISSGYLAYLVGKPTPTIKHLKGHRVWEGKEAVKRITKKSAQECKFGGVGLKMHPSFKWNLSLQRETRSVLIVGGTGGGKTQIIFPFIEAAIVRGDRAVIYDVKGDFTAILPNHILLAPWDQRSYAWDVAKDIRNAQDARQFASKIIPEGNDPIWHNAARQILTAVLIKLQTEKGISWTWTCLFDECCSDQNSLLATVKQYQPEAIHVINEQSKTTQSILVNFSANMSLISDLSKAWGSRPASKRFSFREWLSNPNTKNRTVVMQGSGIYEQLSKAYIQGMMTFAAGFINSPNFPDSRDQRIWFFLDECPTIGKLPELQQILAVGRSKGVRIVLTAQDIHQIRQIYGAEVAATWTSNAGTLIVTKLASGETANYFAKEVIGYRSIERTEFHDGKIQPVIKENELVIEPSEFQTELGPNGKVVKAILLGFGDAYILEWPIRFTTKSDLLRPSSIEADWLKPKAQNKQNTSSAPQSGTKSDKQNQAKQTEPKLRLKLPSELELNEMALIGTPENLAAESLDLLTQNPTGGSHE